MNPLITVILLFLGLLTLVLLKKEQRGMAGGCATLLILLVIGQGIYASFSGTRGERNIVRAQEVISEGVAQKIAERYPRAKVVILGLRETPNMNWMNEGYLEIQKQLAQACKKRKLKVEILPYKTGLDEKDSILLDPELGIADGELGALSAENPAEPEMVSAKLLTRRLLELKGSADVVIMSLPLPPDFGPSDLPAKNAAPHLVVLCAPPWDDFEAVMESSVLDVVLKYRLGSTQLLKKEWPRDNAEAFEERYYFFTAGSKGPQSLRSRDK